MTSVHDILMMNSLLCYVLQSMSAWYGTVGNRGDGNLRLHRADRAGAR